MAYKKRHVFYHFHLLLHAFSFCLPSERHFFFTIFTFSLPNCYLPLLCSFFPFFHSPCFFTSKAMIFYTKIVIFISDSMTTISYWRSSPSLHFYIVFLVEEHTKAVILISKLSECREGERTLKLHFLSPKSFDLLSQTDLISLFLYLRFLCFFVSHNTKAYIFLVNLFDAEVHTIVFSSIFSLFFWFMIKFFHLRQLSQTCSFFLIPIFLGFFDFLQDKIFNFFGCFPFILYSVFSHYKKFKFFYFVF
ncbi:hypothetical protein GLYMA_19G015251v4 [Glycine max]|nr:hypothetical protein GLYMA_19G015251v4 [Glycine max]KAG4395707.1 hypothetical protein GLYMA_19G015251v4 [Glycine max]